MLGRKKSFPKPQLVLFAELCSKNEALCLMWRAEVGTSAEGFKVNPGPWPAPAPASPGSLQFPPAAIPGCCQAPSWPPSGHLAPIPGRRRRRPRSICTNSRSTAQRPLCYYTKSAMCVCVCAEKHCFNVFLCLPVGPRTNFPCNSNDT